MKPRYSKSSGHLARARWMLAITVLLLSGASIASAQWTAADAQRAFSGYNNAFYFNPSGDNFDYRVKQGSTSATSFWMAAEQIEMAVDAYVENPISGNLTIVNQLVNGFNTLHPSWWNGADSFDDDLMWATIAFTRAYIVTGTTADLTDAEDAFNTVWNRGHDATFGGGIWWNSSCESGCSGANKNSAANWTFVTAGHLIYSHNGGTGAYLSRAQTIYSWLKSTLYVSSTGELFDSIMSSGTVANDYSYNYGMAIEAASESSDPTAITNIANYLIYDLDSNGNTKPYAGVTSSGYNILPNYGQGGTDGGGFNGVTLRGIGVANAHGSISSTVLAWAQANVSQAWAERNATTQSWNDWVSATPSSGLYSWDCSDTLVGMLDIPTP